MSPEEFREKYVMRNVNTFVVAPSHLKHPFFKKWQPSGRRWLTSLVVPRARGQITIREPKDAYKYISAATGFSNPLVNGSIADEFITSEPHCAIYADAVGIHSYHEAKEGRRTGVVEKGKTKTIELNVGIHTRSIGSGARHESQRARDANGPALGPRLDGRLDGRRVL